jgi:hypothetical protein
MNCKTVCVRIDCMLRQITKYQHNASSSYIQERIYCALVSTYHHIIALALPDMQQNRGRSFMVASLTNPPLQSFQLQLQLIIILINSQ